MSILNFQWDNAALQKMKTKEQQNQKAMFTYGQKETPITYQEPYFFKIYHPCALLQQAVQGTKAFSLCDFFFSPSSDWPLVKKWAVKKRELNHKIEEEKNHNGCKECIFGKLRILVKT